ncbi:unnamed protein product [Periconia digitata]|uniref:Autophagy-related protein 29 n=1 Tax=Periconia digitata TaxID=1303443 RepID=A0A9W4UIV6_9PLEO|nr:unnamed protein product [Periconia digitata]
MSGVQFTALIRLPFARGDFAEPPPVRLYDRSNLTSCVLTMLQASWDSSKDRALWRLVSKSAKASDLNCKIISYSISISIIILLLTEKQGWSSDSFNVPPAFLLQQAAWLYERHLEHVRAQLKRVGGGAPATPSGLDSTHTVMGGIPMKRIGSAGSAASRTTSSQSTRPKDNPASTGEVGTTGTYNRLGMGRITAKLMCTAPTLSRTPSTNTITQSRANQAPPGRQQKPLYRQKMEQERIERGKSTITSSGQPRSSSPDFSPSTRSLSSSSTSESESESDNPATRSQLFKRPPRFRSQRARDLSAHDEDIEESDEVDADSGGMLPFANSSARAKGTDVHGFSAATSRPGNSKAGRAGAADLALKQDAGPSGTEASSSMASSSSDAPKSDLASPGPLSPRHRESLVRASPRRLGNRSVKEGSEGTPSMGSSFSDIDDASISQSALEEALLSNIQHGRMSTLSQLRSRYL